MLEHIKNSYKHRFLLSESDLKRYKEKAILFLIRRVKFLLSRSEYVQALKYLSFSFKIDKLCTFLTLVKYSFSSV